MLIHFLTNYNIDGRIGNRIRIRGVFPGINQDDLIFLNQDGSDNDSTYKIEEIEYMSDNAFRAVISVNAFDEFELKA